MGHTFGCGSLILTSLLSGCLLPWRTSKSSQCQSESVGMRIGYTPWTDRKYIAHMANKSYTLWNSDWAEPRLWRNADSEVIFIHVLYTFIDTHQHWPMEAISICGLKKKEAPSRVILLTYTPFPPRLGGERAETPLIWHLLSQLAGLLKARWISLIT